LPSSTLIVIAIALEASDPTMVAFKHAAEGVLGPEAVVEVETTANDPPDQETAARGARADGIVELTLNAADGSARLHCYLSREQRWLDREIAFGAGGPTSEREAAERGRLLGFAAATMFASDGGAPPPDAPPVPPQRPPRTTPDRAPSQSSGAPPATRRNLSFEFAGTVSSGIGGTAAGLGATAAVRFRLSGLLGARAFLAGRAGSIPEAQSTTRTLEMGGGLAAQLLPEPSRWILGVRTDAMLSYFEAVHFSADDAVPDERARLLPGADLLLEPGFRLTDAVSLYAGAGVTAMLGTTTVHTHGKQVAVVPVLRAVGELGLRTGF
jgi:hypothetical protein